LSAQANISFNRNRIDKLGATKSWTETSYWIGYSGQGTTNGDYWIEEGGKIGQMYGFETDGMYSFDDFTYENGTYKLKENIADDNKIIGTVKPGMLKLKDQNGDYLVTDTDDKVVIGDANPKHIGGFQFKYRL